MKLSELILDYRKRMNISQREFSRRCDLSNTYISFLENEMNPKTKKPIIPTLEQYAKIAHGMDISVHHLFELLDADAPVDLRSSAEVVPEADSSRPEIRLLIRGLSKLSPSQVEQATNVFRAMFMQTNPDLFKEEGDDDK